MRDFEKLSVWQKSHEFTLDLYTATSQFPGAELYGLTSQLRRAAASVPANLAEGCGRDSDAELARYVRIAMGSGNEMEYLLILARDLGYLSADNYESLMNALLEVKRMLAGLLTRLSNDRLRLEA
jgi:four helix bundle protein